MQIVKSEFELPMPLTNFAVLNDNDSIMIAGGITNKQQTTSVIKINSNFKHLYLPNLNHPRSDFTLSKLGSDIWAIGGSN